MLLLLRAYRGIRCDIPLHWGQWGASPAATEGYKSKKVSEGPLAPATHRDLTTDWQGPCSR